MKTEINDAANLTVASVSNKVPRLALTITEAAAALGYNERTVYRLIVRGLLKVSRATSKPVVPVAEIIRFLNETTT